MQDKEEDGQGVWRPLILYRLWLFKRITCGSLGSYQTRRRTARAWEALFTVPFYSKSHMWILWVLPDNDEDGPGVGGPVILHRLWLFKRITCARQGGG